MAEKNPLDDIVDDLVVFKHEDPNHPDGQYFSNNAMWRDSRVREHWMNRHSDEAKASQAEADNEQGVEDEEEVPDYTTWTNDSLRAELVNRELSVDGNKAALVARLEEDDAAQAEADEEE